MIPFKPFLSLTFLLLLLFSLFSCTGDLVQEGCYELSTDEQISIFNFISEVDAIQLETSDESFLTGIMQLQIFGSRVYILDPKRVLCFSTEGEYLFQFSRQGNGPGEFNHASDIAIDKENERLLILDAFAQRVLYFDLEGNYLETLAIDTEIPLGLNRVFPLPDSLLLFVGLHQKDFILYCLKVNMILERFGGVEDCPPYFSPDYNVHLFESDAYIFPPFENKVYKVSRDGFIKHREWCFGKNDNTPAQIEELKGRFRYWRDSRRRIMPNYLVGKGKYLNNMILFSFENKRFVFAQIEFENDFSYVFIDKKTGDDFSFRSFEEGINIFPVFINQHALIVPFIPEEANWSHPVGGEDQQYVEDYHNRNHTFYTRDLLTERGKQVYDNHDPMHDNPYLIIFKFKE